MIDPVRLSTKYVVDTDIIINTLKGVQEAVQALEQLENDDFEVYYSTIVETVVKEQEQVEKELFNGLQAFDDDENGEQA